MKNSILMLITVIGFAAVLYLDYEFNKKKIEHAYERGVMVGRKYHELNGVDSVLINIKSGPPAKKDSSINQRYFLVAFRFGPKDGPEESEGGYGSMSFGYHQYPSRYIIDSLILDGLPLKKSRYQPPVIMSMYEFINKADFDNFSTGGRKWPHSKS